MARKTTTRESASDLPWFAMLYKDADRNPFMGSDGPAMDHYRITLTGAGGRMRFTYSKGAGHRGMPPTLAEVVECLASDARMMDGAADFAEWCAETGCEVESRMDERWYRAGLRQRDSLRCVCGTDAAYNALLALDSFDAYAEKGGVS